MDDQTKSMVSDIEDLVNKNWIKDRTPYLLSNLGMDLRAIKIDYKPNFSNIKLIDFVKSNASSLIKIVQHPTQKAKIGLVPARQDYEFSPRSVESTSSSALQHINPQPRRPRNARHVVMNFLEVLADLEPEELEQVHIPVSVLAKLVAGK